MFEKIKIDSRALIIFLEVLLVYLGFWFMFKNLNTDGIWETVLLNIFFFLILPNFFWGRKQAKENIGNNPRKWLIWLEIGGFLVVFSLLVKLGELSFLKLNYLSRIDWYIGDWSAIIFLDLVLLPIILFSQEFFFRKVLIEELAKSFILRGAILAQAILFAVFETLFFEIFDWRFVLFNLILGVFLGYIYHKSEFIWYSLIARWLMILILDGSVLYLIQQVKS